MKNHFVLFLAFFQDYFLEKPFSFSFKFELFQFFLGLEEFGFHKGHFLLEESSFRGIDVALAKLVELKADLVL